MLKKSMQETLDIQYDFIAIDINHLLSVQNFSYLKTLQTLALAIKR